MFWIPFMKYKKDPKGFYEVLEEENL